MFYHFFKKNGGKLRNVFISDREFPSSFLFLGLRALSFPEVDAYYDSSLVGLKSLACCFLYFLRPFFPSVKMKCVRAYRGKKAYDSVVGRRKVFVYREIQRGSPPSFGGRHAFPINSAPFSSAKPRRRKEGKSQKPFLLLLLLLLFQTKIKRGRRRKGVAFQPCKKRRWQKQLDAGNLISWIPKQAANENSNFSRIPSFNVSISFLLLQGTTTIKGNRVFSSFLLLLLTAQLRERRRRRDREIYVPPPPPPPSATTKAAELLPLTA